MKHRCLPQPFQPVHFASTGEQVSCLGVGGSHLGGTDVAETLAIRIIRTAIEPLDESLERLGVDHIDLVQLHEIIRYEDEESKRLQALAE